MRVSIKLSTILATAMAVASYSGAVKTSFARGGGHEGEHHDEHHEEHHEEEHHEEEHRPEHVAERHHEEHHDEHHWNHHHHDWHYAHWGWGPGFWGDAAVGYGLGEWGGWGGNTYIDNSDSENSTCEATPLAENASGSSDPSNNPSDLAANDNATNAKNRPTKLPVELWPELGVSTFTGHKGEKQGLVVVRVVPHSAAAKAGVVAGDVILEFNDESTPSDQSLEELLESTHGDFKMLVCDARTGKERYLNGDLDPNQWRESQGG